MKKLLVVAVIPLLMGCGASFNNSRLSVVEELPARDKDQVEVILRADQAALRAHQVLGKVYVQKRGATIFSKPSEESLIDMLLTPASEMGAEALIDAHSSLYFGKDPNSIKRWASGLAVKWVDGTHEITPAPFVVCVPPLVNLDTDDPEQIAKDDLNARETAQHFLETLGYYAMKGDVPVTEEEVRAMSDDRLDQVIGEDAQLILILTLEGYAGANIGLVGSKQSTLKASLFQGLLVK